MGALRGPMQPYGAIHGLGQYELTPHGAYNGPPMGTLRALEPYGALRGLGQYELTPPGA